MIKKIFGLLILAFLLSGFHTVYADIYSIGEPKSVTITATAAVAGTWTVLLDSDTFCRKWKIHERTNAYNCRYTYNSVTYTVVDDYFTLKAGEVMSDRLHIPDGIYVSTTWTSGASITIEFESAK